jgi:hypothetical protein
LNKFAGHAEFLEQIASFDDVITKCIPAHNMASYGILLLPDARQVNPFCLSESTYVMGVPTKEKLPGHEQ